MPSAQDQVWSAEGGTWREISGEWRQLYGNFGRSGISIEHHRFTNRSALKWDRSFHQKSLEICLNFQGAGELVCKADGIGSTAIALGKRAVALYSPGQGSGQLSACRAPNEHHHFITVEMSREFLNEALAPPDRALLLPPVRAFASRPAGAALPFAFALPTPMSVGLQNLGRSLIEPPAPPRAQSLWYEAKVLELISLLLIDPPSFAGPAQNELFCSRQKRITRERVRLAQAILERDLANPPSLQMLAAEVGGSPSHLSRSFAEYTGRTISHFLRDVRLERAAQMLREHRSSVTEAAIAVGYNSLSHFSKAFWEAFGCCPGLYGNPGLAKAAQSDRTQHRRLN